ncbi:MAG TPA: DNA polymerase domain-containing protein [Polyangiaceae bacterium]|nr:DNA polymerase domain-containing protein [Polyangiaceae bacterium]
MKNSGRGRGPDHQKPVEPTPAELGTEAASPERGRDAALTHRTVDATLAAEWLWGWDATPGIVSVWAEMDGRVWVWRRSPETLELVQEHVRFRPWLLLGSLRDLEHLQNRLVPSSSKHARERGHFSYHELNGPGELRYWVSAADGRDLTRAVLRGASERLGYEVRDVRELAPDVVLLSPEEQYLTRSGRTYFRGLSFDQVRRMHLDLETTGLDAEVDRIFLVALRMPDGRAEVLRGESHDDVGEAALLRKTLARIAEYDPDVLENHNLHGFDVPFLVRRCQHLGIKPDLGRLPGLKKRAAARGMVNALSTAAGPQARPRDSEEMLSRSPTSLSRRARFSVPGRELLDTLDAVLRYDFAARDLPGHGLKEVARHLGLAQSDREYLPAAQAFSLFQHDPERVMRYARDDVQEAAAVGRLLGGAAFGLAQMAPRRYERLADAGPATGVLDPMLLRAYLHSDTALPRPSGGDGTPHTGAALYLFATGVAQNIVKADVASLYPSLMRQYRIGPQTDVLGALLTLVEHWVEQRLRAKSLAKTCPPHSPERFGHEALAAALKLLVNSAYGYLGAVGLTRFSDVHAANEVTRHGRELLDLLCQELAERGVTLLEADTDGVYFSVPPGTTEAQERGIVEQVAALLPEQVHLEFDGRYKTMLSHEPKNYALLGYDDQLILRGVAFRSRRAEPFGELFLERALRALLSGDIEGVRQSFIDTLRALRRRELPTGAVAALVRLTKTPEQYLAAREKRRELPYEALIGRGRFQWSVGERIRVYRTQGGGAGLFDEEASEDARDYHVVYYARLLRDTFAARLARAFSREDYELLFADPTQLSLFERPIRSVRPILTTGVSSLPATRAR